MDPQEQLPRVESAAAANGAISEPPPLGDDEFDEPSPNSANPTKIADRPHLLTALLMLLQPLITLIGVGLAIATLRQNNENFMIANRAYLDLENSKIEVDLSTIHAQLDLANSGNTPAENAELFLALFPDGDTKGPKVRRIAFPGHIPPHAKRHYGYSIRTNTDNYTNHLILTILFRYSDVFGQELTRCSCVDILMKESVVSPECDREAPCKRMFSMAFPGLSARLE